MEPPASPPQAKEAINPAALPAVIALLENELRLCPMGDWLESDIPIAQGLWYAQHFPTVGHSKNPHLCCVHIGTAMRGLRWRYRIQESFLLVAKELVKRNMADPKCFFTPIPWQGYRSKNWSRRKFWLESWQIPGACRDLSRGQDLEGHFDAPVTWLVWIIEQSNIDEEALTQLLKSLGSFGSFDKKHFAFWQKLDNPGQLGGDTPVMPNRHLPQMGFWLPYHLDPKKDSLEDALSATHPRVDKAVEVYEKCFGHGRWKKKSLFGLDDDLSR